MTTYQQAELAGRIEVALRKLLDAIRKHDWEAFDHHMEKIGELRGTARTVVLKDVTDKPGATTVQISVENGNLALTIHPEGTGTWDGPYAPVLLERKDGSIRLVVWGDIRQQDPTHIIDLTSALETGRSADTH